MTESETETDRPETERVLEIRVQDFESFASGSTAALEDALRTRDGESSVLAFETPRQALSLFSDARYELLETIRTADPESIRELARLLDRDASAVHRDLERLAEYGIVTFREEGRNKRPVLGYEQIRIDLDLTFDTELESSAAAES